MLSIPDMALLGAAALLFFGPEQLPKVAKKAGGFMRDMQNLSHEFVREMERAADEHPEPGATLPAEHDYYAGAPTNGVPEPAPVTPAVELPAKPLPPASSYELPP